MDFVAPTLRMRKLRQTHEDLAQGCDLAVAEWDLDPGLSDSPCHFRPDPVQSLRKGGPRGGVTPPPSEEAELAE